MVYEEVSQLSERAGSFTTEVEEIKELLQVSDDPSFKQNSVHFNQSGCFFLLQADSSVIEENVTQVVDEHFILLWLGLELSLSFHRLAVV
jgi:hypothetical protein